MQDRSGTLGQKTRHGISWTLVGAIAINGMRVIVLAVLGRVLSSSDFGIVAAAVAVNAIVYSIRDVGIGTALVQRKELQDEHLRTAFAVSMYVGFVIGAVLIIAARSIGEIFHIPESVDVIAALALLFVLRNVAVTSRMMCRRDMNFRLIAIVDASSFTLGSSAAIAAALVWGGPWSLVIGYWVEEVIATLLFLLYHPPKWSLRVDRARLRELLGFGAGQTVTQVANVIAMYGDNAIVGRSLGPSALGFYSRAFDLVKFPALVFGTVVGSVLFSAFSRIQDDRPRLATNFRRITFASALVLLPASAALIVLAPEAIRLLIGPNWDAAVAPFQILAVTIAIRTNQRLAMLVATAAGNVNGVAISTVIYVIVLVSGAAISVQWGVTGVATTTSIAATLLWIECCYFAMRVSGVTVSDLVRAHAPGIALALLVVASGWPVASALRSDGFSAAVVFVATGLLVTGVCAALAALWIRTGRGDFAWLGGELRRLRHRRAPRVGSS
jgi:O-antigen/teichoic acid export membrane protein